MSPKNCKIQVQTTLGPRGQLVDFSAANDLAERLFSSLKDTETASRSCRKIGDHARRENLTLDEIEQVLERWKLEGPHGG